MSSLCSIAWPDSWARRYAGKFVQLLLVASMVLGIVPGANATLSDDWRPVGYDKPLFGADFDESEKRLMAPGTGKLLIKAVYDLETNQDSGVIGQFIGLPRPQMVQARLHLEHELKLNNKLSDETRNRILFQFDRTIGATAQGVVGDTFTLDNTAVNISAMPPKDQSYLLALTRGDVLTAAGLRNEIIGSRVLDLTSGGYSYDDALDFANTEFALTNDLIASAADIPVHTISETTLLSLSDQGIPTSDAPKIAYDLGKLSANTKGIGSAMSQREARFELPQVDGYFDGYGLADFQPGQSGGLDGWIDKLSNHWAEMRESNMVVSSLAPADSSGNADNEDVSEQDTSKKPRELTPTEKNTALQVNVVKEIMAESTDESRLFLREFSEADRQSVSSDIQVDKGYAEWVDSIKLEDTDLIYGTLVRWLGGIFVEIREAYTSNGKFNESFTTSGLSTSGTPTASYYSLTIITYIVLVIATYLASIYFVYGLYKGAEEGTFFGRNHDTSLTFGRMFISLAGNIPIPNLLGLTPVQVFLIVSMLFSLAIAGAAATFLTKKMVSIPMVTPIEKRNTSFVSSILKSQICMASIASHGMLRESEEDSAYFKSTFNYNTVIKEEDYTPSFDDSLIGKFRNWLNGSKKYKEQIDMDEIRHVYEDLGLNKFTDKLARYRFGAEGRCGTFYVREGVLTTPILIEGEDAPLPSEASPDQSISDVKLDFNTDHVSKWIGRVSNQRDQAMALAINDLIEELGVLARNAVEAQSDDDGGLSLAKEVLRGSYSIEQNYYKKLRADLTQILQSSPNPSDKAIVNAVRRLGMGSLGAIYWFIEHKAQQVSKFYDFSAKSGGAASMSTLASSDVGKASSFFNATSFEIQTQITLLQGLVDEIIGDPGIVRAKRLINAAAVNNSIAEPGDSDLLVNWLIQEDWAADADNFNVSPIERVRHFGNSVQTGMLAAGASLIALESFMVGMKEQVGDDGFFGNIPGIKFALAFAQNVLKRMIDMIANVANPLFYAAFIASNVIPAMPFIMFTAAIVGLLVRYYSMLVAAPVWWMQKMHLGGGDLTGHASVGWSYYFQMMLHAPLIVIGFIGGLGLNWVAGHFVNITFMPGQALQAMGGYNPTMYIGQVMVYSGLQVWVCYKSFSLTWEIPALLNSMIGQAFGSPGSDENEGRQSIAAIVGQGTGGVGGSLVTPRFEQPPGDIPEKSAPDKETATPSKTNVGKEPKQDSIAPSSGGMPAIVGSQSGSGINSGKDSGAGGNAGTSGGSDKGKGNGDRDDA